MVHVAPFVDGNVICQKLEGHGSHERGKGFLDAGHLDAVVRNGTDNAVAFSDDGNDFATACLDFLYI